MQISKKSDFYLLVIVLVVLSTLTDYVLTGPFHFISVLAPSIGIVVILHTLDRKYTTTISLVLHFFTVVLLQITIINTSFLLALFISFYKTLVLFIMIILFDHIRYHLKDNGYNYMNKLDIVNFIFTGFFVTFVGATLNLIPIYFIFDFELPLFWYGNSWLGYLFGFFIFGSTLNYSILYDEKVISPRKIYLGFGFIIVLNGLCYILFSSIFEGFNYHNFSYLLLALYLVAVTFFNFRTILASHFVIFIHYSIFHYNHVDQFDLMTELFSIILILLILTGSSVFFKNALLKSQRKENETMKMKNSIKDIMLSSNDILKDIKNIAMSTSTYSNNFLINMFRMGCNILNKCDYASLYIKKNGKIQFIDTVGYDIKHLNRFEIDEKSFEWTHAKPKIINRKEYQFEYDFSKKTDDFDYPDMSQSILFTVWYNDQPVAGMSFDISVYSKMEFTKEDLQTFKELTDMINSYYDLIVIQDTNNSFRNDIVISLVRALGLYDSYTGKHSEEVAFLSLEISKRLKLSNAQTNRIYWSAIVHDIGKIGIKPNIINKDGLLSTEEKKEVEKHSIFGYRILNSVEGLKDVALRVRHHHERWDGTGYPDGLKENQIPLCSQVLAVCDAVSAMSRNRVYSRAKSIDDILIELQTERGKQFSPFVADAMIAYITESRLVDYYLETQ